MRGQLLVICHVYLHDARYPHGKGHQPDQDGL